MGGPSAGLVAMTLDLGPGQAVQVQLVEVVEALLAIEATKNIEEPGQLTSSGTIRLCLPRSVDARRVTTADPWGLSNTVGQWLPIRVLSTVANN